jgi:ferrous iron transport protein A
MQHKQVCRTLRPEPLRDPQTTEITVPALNIDQGDCIMVLSDLNPGSSCTIRNLHARDRLGQRLMDLGIFPGVALRVLRNAPLEDPMEVEVGGMLLSLRHEEARFVEVELQ